MYVCKPIWMYAFILRMNASLFMRIQWYVTVFYFEQKQIMDTSSPKIVKEFDDIPLNSV
jgi:hypothetical protein